MKTYDLPQIDKLTALIAENTQFKTLYTVKMNTDFSLTGEVDDFIAEDLSPHQYEKSLKELMDDHQLIPHLVSQLISDYYQMILEADQYLLNPDYVLMNPEDIYYQGTERRFMFVYLPLKTISKLDFNHILRHLMAQLFLDKKINHKDMYKMLSALEDKDYKSIQKILKTKTKTKKNWHSLLRSSQPSNHQEEVMVNLSAYILNKSNPEEKYNLCYKQNTIGRGKENTICLEHEKIALTQAIIYKKDLVYRIRSVSKEASIKLNQEEIVNESHLKSGDTLYIGNKEFIFIA